jgi:hypothetical protein
MRGEHPRALTQAPPYVMRRFPRSYPTFSDQVDETAAYKASLTAVPAASINTTAAAQSWLDSADAKTALLILQSLTYQQ